MLISSPMQVRWTRRATIRRPTRSPRPRVEPIEPRQLLSGTPLMIINSTTVQLEGQPAQMDFTVWMTRPSTQTVTVQFNTENQTAQAGPDYVATRGTLTFQPGQTSKTIPVTIKNASSPDPIEQLGLQLSHASHATLLQGLALGAILPPPAQAQVAINNVERTRGLSGTKTLVFTVSLNEVLTQPVTVTATTSNGTALAGVDYVAKTQVLTIPPGQLTTHFAVTIQGTKTPTPQKFFLVTLSHASVPIAVAIGAGILDYGA